MMTFFPLQLNCISCLFFAICDPYKDSVKLKMGIVCVWHVGWNSLIGVCVCVWNLVIKVINVAFCMK